MPQLVPAATPVPDPTATPAPRELPEPPLEFVPTPDVAVPVKLLPEPWLLALAEPPPIPATPLAAEPEPTPDALLGPVPNAEWTESFAETVLPTLTDWPPGSVTVPLTPMVPETATLVPANCVGVPPPPLPPPPLPPPPLPLPPLPLPLLAEPLPDTELLLLPPPLPLELASVESVDADRTELSPQPELRPDRRVACLPMAVC